MGVHRQPEQLLWPLDVSKLGITTEHTEKESNFHRFSFRVFSVFRGSVIGSFMDSWSWFN